MESGEKASLFWRVVAGAPVLTPGGTSTYVLLPPPSQARRMTEAAQLYVVTDDPQTLTVISLPRAPHRQARTRSARPEAAP